MKPPLRVLLLALTAMASAGSLAADAATAAVAAVSATFTSDAAAGSASGDGRALIETSVRRHAPPPYVFEQQTLVLSNSLGQHTVRTARHYVRRDEDASRDLLIVDTPVESRGMSVFVVRNAQGEARRGADPASRVFGSDFAVADIEGEQPRDFNYRIEGAQDINRVPHHLLRATPRDAAVARSTGYGERRIYLRKDNLFISRIEHLDRHGRLAKRQTFRDPRPDEAGAWRPGMVLMEDLQHDRRTLIKIERRVHSADYVPPEVFAGQPGQRP